MTEISKSLLQLIRDQISDALFNLHTGLPAKVVSFDAETQSCSVQPLFKRVFLDNDGVPHSYDYPVITNVPVEFPNWGGWSITGSLEEDDIVYLAFFERSIDRWLDAPVATIVDPLSNHKFDLSDACARPGPRPRSGAIPGIPDGGIRIAKDDSSCIITLTDAGVSINGALISLGDPATHPAVHGDALVSILGLVSTFIGGLVAACTPPAGPLGKSDVLPLASAYASAIAPLMAQLLSAKVVIE